MLYLAICDEKNRIYKDETALATARTGDVYSELLEEDVIPLPEGSNVMRLPERIPVGINPESGDFAPGKCGCGHIAARIYEDFSPCICIGEGRISTSFVRIYDRRL